MGDFAGHMANGTMLFLVGLFWLYNVLYRYFLCQREASILQKDSTRAFRTDMMFPIRCYPRVPIIPMGICLVVGVTMIREYTNNYFMHTNNYIHFLSIQHVLLVNGSYLRRNDQKWLIFTSI